MAMPRVPTARPDMPGWICSGAPAAGGWSMPIPAPARIQAQAATITAVSADTTMIRSRASSTSSLVGPAAPPRPAAAGSTGLIRSGTAELLLVPLVAVHEAVLVPCDVRQRAVPAAQVELDGPGALGDAGRVLGLVEHPPLRQDEDRPLLLVRHRVADGLAARLEHAGDGHPRRAPVQVPVELDVGEDRVLDRLDDRREDL